MTHPERKLAKRYDNPGRCRAFTDAVYSGDSDTPQNLFHILENCDKMYNPKEPEFIPLIGDLHGHSNLSDGTVDPDEYYRRLKEDVKLDFAALTDHDHGGVGKPELWVGNPSKWDKIKALAKKYYEPGRFTPILGYERDSYPFYNNMVLYFNNYDADMVRGERDGEITEKELRALLLRDDVIFAPHDTYFLSSGADFSHLPFELLSPLMEVISRGDAAEYMGNPAFDEPYCCEGGFWQDALKRGAEMGVIGGSDDHRGEGGKILNDYPYPKNFPGLTGVWAKENSLAAIFEALKAKRTFAFMGGHVTIDFRINGHFMGEKIERGDDGDLHIWFSVTADAKIKKVTLVKNYRDYMIFKVPECLVIDYMQETEKDCFYLRVELSDGRFGWTSPIWVI